MKFSISILLALCLNWSITAQQTESIYTIQLGAFVEPQTSDFDPVRELGYVFTERMDKDLYLVFLSAFKTRKAANELVRQVHAKAYTDAFVVKRKLEKGHDVHVIQLAAYGENETIKWETYARLGELYTFIQGGKLKICMGLFPDKNFAQQQLGLFHQKGFKGAFPRTINSMLLHKVNVFDTGNRFDHAVETYEKVLAVKGEAPGGNPASARIKKTPNNPIHRLSSAHGKIKRNSVIALQRILKKESNYNAATDGFYGEKTRQAFEYFTQQNWQYKKYKILSDHIKSPDLYTGNELQKLIDQIPADKLGMANALSGIKHPLGQAYQAFALFSDSGPGATIDELMNSAIKQAFQAKEARNQAPFNYNAEYRYTNFDQLVLHIRYLHALYEDNLAAPCWLFELYPDEALAAFEPNQTLAMNSYALAPCHIFTNWTEVAVLQALAIDLNPDDAPAFKELEAAKNRRAQLALGLKPLSNQEQIDLTQWEKDLLDSFSHWVAKDRVHNKWDACFNVAWHQSRTRLEDYFLDRGFNTNQSAGLSLGILQTIVDPYLKGF